MLVALHQYLVGQAALGYLESQQRQASQGLLEVPVALQLLWWECPEGSDAALETEVVVVAFHLGGLVPHLEAYWVGLEET